MQTTEFAFDLLAASYDATFGASVLGTRMRAAVWRRLDACFAPGQRILYAYWAHSADEKVREFHPGTPIGGSWRVELVEDSAIGDIDEFGLYYLHTDNSHPDEEGHRLIAETLLPAVLEIEARGP